MFTSMLGYYYDVKAESEFETLFKDPYVYKYPTLNKNHYYILKFDFSGITTTDKNSKEVEDGFKSCVITGINNFLTHYDFSYEIDRLSAPDIILKNFLSFFCSLRLEHKLYILIDEYDNFTNAILECDAKRFIGIVGNAGFVKGFYAVIKEYIGLGIIDIFFATGIAPVTLDAITTGFNIATDISRDVRFNEMIGLTHDEVMHLLENVSDNEKQRLYDMMCNNYDGYLFSIDASKKLFNATLAMYFLKNYYDFMEIPRELIDKNIVTNYGKIDNILKLQNKNFYEEIIDTLLKTNEITGILKNSFNLGNFQK